MTGNVSAAPIAACSLSASSFRLAMGLRAEADSRL